MLYNDDDDSIFLVELLNVLESVEFLYESLLL